MGRQAGDAFGEGLSALGSEDGLALTSLKQYPWGGF